MLDGLIAPVARVLIRRARARPYFHLSDYMERWWLFGAPRQGDTRPRWRGRIHCTRRSDLDRALHDHPWANASLLLEGGYWEIVQGAYQDALERAYGDLHGLPEVMLALHTTIHATPGSALPRAQRRAYAAHGVHWRGVGSVVFRSATTLHRLVLPAGGVAWSLFIMAPKVREWGFLDPLHGWIHHSEYAVQLGRDQQGRDA